MNMKNLALCIVFIATSLAVHASILYDQSFNYSIDENGDGFTDANFPGEGWSSGSGVITYEHSSGLTYSGVSSAGGAMVYDFGGTTSNRGADQTFSFDYGSYAAGQVYEFSALMEVERIGFTNAYINFDGTAVNDVTFGVTSTDMYVTAWMDGATTTVTGPAYSTDTTLGYLMRVTQGSGASPTDSLVEIWFNPDYSNLGTANFTSTFDTRIGRSGASNAYTRISYGGSTIGDARVIWDEVQVVAIPEPGTLALVGIALGSLLLFRRRR